MILVTGGTGFIGQVLIRQLVQRGEEVRTLIRPSSESPRLPWGVPVEVAVSGLRDERGLRAAMKGIKTVYHLAGVESRGSSADLMAVDIEGAQVVAKAARDAGVDRLFFLSHLGADRASAFPVFKAKAIAEAYLRDSGVDTTILRTGLVFGAGDHFSTGIAILLASFPLFFILPGDGKNLIHPIWVEDLVTCLTWALDDDATRNQVYSVGGPEYLNLRQAVEAVMSATGSHRWFMPISPPYLRALTVYLEDTFPGFPASVFWLDYFAANRTAPIDVLPREFGLIPSRFNQRLGYLKGQPWQRSFRQMFTRRRRA